MSFVQCKDTKEVEKSIPDDGAGFVSEDCRVYQSIELYADGMVYELNPETLMHLFRLQTQLEWMSDDFNHEMCFKTVTAQAQELEAAYDKALEAVKFMPLVQKKKPG